MPTTLLSYMMNKEQKTYDFTVKFANIEPSDENLDRIEHALASFEIVKSSKPKHLPPEDTSLDFPKLGACCDVYLMTVSLKYPCTDEQVRHALAYQGRIPAANVVVIPKDQPEEIQRENEREGVETRHADVDGQPMVGQKRLETLKDLETRKYEIEGEKTDKAKTTNELPQNNKSPMVARKVKK